MWRRIAIAALALAGCGAPAPAPATLPPPPPFGAAAQPVLRAERDRYSEHDVVRLTLRVGAEALRVDLCRPRLERRDAGAWRAAAPLPEPWCPQGAPDPLAAGLEVTVGRRVPPGFPPGEYRYVAAAVEEGSGRRVELATAPFSVVRHPLLAALVIHVRAAPAAPRAGDTVRFEAVARNVSGDSLPVGTACGPPLDVTIRSPSGDTLSVLSHMVGPNAGFDCIGRPPLAPGDSLVQRLWWRAPRVRGVYEAVAHVRRHGVQPRSVPLHVTVR